VSALSREAFADLVFGSNALPWVRDERIVKAYNAMADERDAARAELESPELRYEIASKFCHETQIEYEAAGPRSPHESIAATNRVLARWGQAAGKNVGSASQTDPRIEAWRALDAEQREIVFDLMRGAPQLKAYSEPTRRALGDAAAALEALGEGR